MCFKKQIEAMQVIWGLSFVRKE